MEQKPNISPDADPLNIAAVKGRGAASNRAGRFERHRRVLADDGWGVHEPPKPSPARRGAAAAETDAEKADADGFEIAAEEAPPKLRTILGVDSARTVIARNTSPDVPFDRSINPYRGCEHGCVYCFARPTHAYYGLSPGLDFETKLFHKPDAPDLLRRELSRPGYRPKPIALGTNTDPYQPIEKDQELTRRILAVLAEFNHPFTIVTKSALVTRDLDILAPMAERNMARVYLSVTTLDRKLANKLEPRAATPDKRLAAVRTLSQAGVPTGVMAAPIIPGLNDAEIERIVAASAEAGAYTVGYVLLRLPLEIKDLFTEWLVQHTPDRAARVLSLIQQTRGGRLNNAEWGKRMRGEGPVADLIAQRFKKALARHKLEDRGAVRRDPGPLDCSRFADPARARQLALF